MEKIKVKRKKKEEKKKGTQENLQKVKTLKV